MNIAIKVMLLAQGFRHAHQALHGVIRALENTRAEKQPLNIIAAIEINGEINHLLYRKRRATHIITAPAHTIGAVIDTVIGKQDFQQGNAAAVLGITVANTHTIRIAQPFIVIGTFAATGRTGGIVFCGVG